VLVVADAHQTTGEIAARQDTVAEVLEMIGAVDVPRLTALNKVDLVDEPERTRLRALYPDAVLISARNGEGLDRLLDRIADHFSRNLRSVRLLVPYADGGVVSRLRGVAADIREESTADGILVTVRLPESEACRYAHYAVHQSGSVAEPQEAQE
jgi:GTP-binding protein HflX